MLTVNIPKKPEVSIKEANAFLNENWTVNAGKIWLKEMDSYDYRTYLVSKEDSSEKLIFKIANENESKNQDFLNCLYEIFTHLHKVGVSKQKMIPSNKNDIFVDYWCTSPDNEKVPLKAFLLTFLEGKLADDVTITAELCYNAGRAVAKTVSSIDEILDRLDSLKERTIQNPWSLLNAPKCRSVLPAFDSETQRNQIDRVLREFDSLVLPKVLQMTQGFIHGDPNERNLIINNDQEVLLIDWQDCSLSVKAYDVAVLIFSLMDVVLGQKTLQLQSPCGLEEVGRHCLAGYQSWNRGLSDFDIEMLPLLIQTRIGMSLSIGQYTHKFLDPHNPYVLNTTRRGWALLQMFLDRKDQLLAGWLK